MEVFYLFSRLFFNHNFPRLKYGKHITFLLQEERPNFFGKIINKG